MTFPTNVETFLDYFSSNHHQLVWITWRKFYLLRVFCNTRKIQIFFRFFLFFRFLFFCFFIFFCFFYFSVFSIYFNFFSKFFNSKKHFFSYNHFFDDYILVFLVTNFFSKIYTFFLFPQNNDL